MNMRIVGYIIFDDASGKFVGCDSHSGNYPWRSDTLSSGMIWRTKKEAEEYRDIKGWERDPFNSSKWRVRGLVITDSLGSA